MFWRQQRASPGHGLLDIQFGSALHLPFNARLVDSIRNNPATAPQPMFDWDTSQPFLPWIEQVYPPVQGDTLAELVERLIARTRDISKDLTYQQIFFTTYPLFTKCEDVFLHLLKRFQALDSHDETRWRVERRHDIMSIMKQWIASPYVQVDSEVLRQMRVFAFSVHHPEPMVRLANDIVDIIESGPRVHPAPPAQRITRPCDVAAITAKDLAVALTIIVGREYDRLRSSDYIVHLCDLEVQDQVKVVCGINHRFTCWVKQAILRPERLQSRAAALKLFIEIAEECRKLRNFASAAAIIDAWESPPVWRLTLTRDEVDPSARRTRAQLDRLSEPEHYRAALHSPKNYNSCIPWLDFHLRELRDLLESNPAHIETADGEFINFTRCIDFTNAMKELSQFKAPVLTKYRDESKIAYLESQLRHVDIDRADDELERQSLIHESEERRIALLKIRELQSVGFKT